MQTSNELLLKANAMGTEHVRQFLHDEPQLHLSERAMKHLIHLFGTVYMQGRIDALHSLKLS
jgi:hypothetical protein